MKKGQNIEIDNLVTKIDELQSKLEIAQMEKIKAFLARDKISKDYIELRSKFDKLKDIINKTKILGGER